MLPGSATTTEVFRLASLFDDEIGLCPSVIRGLTLYVTWDSPPDLRYSPQTVQLSFRSSYQVVTASGQSEVTITDGEHNLRVAEYFRIQDSPICDSIFACRCCEPVLA